jgi:hypothetical protein
MKKLSHTCDGRKALITLSNEKDAEVTTHVEMNEKHYNTHATESESLTTHVTESYMLTKHVNE